MEQADLVVLAIVTACAVIAPLLSEYVPGPRIPRVVFEIGLGILVGPQVLGWVGRGTIAEGFGEFGLAFLMFLAGFELDLARVRGKPIEKAAIGWGLSLAIGVAVGGVMMAVGFALSEVIVGLALTTTALGTLLPILQDEGILESRMGSPILAIGTIGEFLPIVAVAIFVTGSNPGMTLLLLAVFVVLSVVGAVIALRQNSPRFLALLQKHLHSTAQLPVRMIVLILVSLLLLADTLELDVLLGAFVAGVIVRLATSREGSHAVNSKLDGIAYGFFIPVFFIMSGVHFDLKALIDEPTTLLRVPLFLALMLLARGLPTFVMQRELTPRLRTGLSFLAATQLPLVVAITETGVRLGQMRPANAAALVGAGLLSVLLFPAIGIAIARPELEADAEATGSTTPQASSPA